MAQQPIPECFTTVDTKVVALRYARFNSVPEIKYGVIVKVSKTRITVEFPGHAGKSYNVQFYAGWRADEHKELAEWGTGERYSPGWGLVLEDDVRVEVARSRQARTLIQRRVASAVDQFRQRTASPGEIRELISTLTEAADELEALGGE